MAAAGAPTLGSGAPATPAREATPDAGSASSTTSATLVVNGNNPAQWDLNKPWQDNLGALFTHGGQSETIYSTTTVDVSAAGTATLDYWAAVPLTQQWLHANRAVVVEGASNENAPAATSTPPAANDNPPPLAPTGNSTVATSTAQ